MIWLLAVVTVAAAVGGAIPVWFAALATVRDLLGARSPTVAGLVAASRLTQAAGLAVLLVGSPDVSADAFLTVAGGMTAVAAATIAAVCLFPEPEATVRRT